MEEAGDLLEDSWFFGNLLQSKTRTISRSYSDLASSTSTQEHIFENDRKNLSFSSRKQPPIAPPSLTRTPSLPNSLETQSLLTKKPDPSPNLRTFRVGNDKKDGMIKNEPKSSSLSSRKSKETQSFWMKKHDPSLTRASSKSTSIMRSDQEDEDDQESEFTLGRLIRQASMNSSHTSNPPPQTSKVLQAMIENRRKKPELDQEKIIDVRKTEKKKSIQKE